MSGDFVRLVDIVGIILFILLWYNHGSHDCPTVAAPSERCFLHVT